MLRIAIITNVLAHYRVTCFRRLAEEMPGQVTFFLLAENMEHRHYVMAKGQCGLPAENLRGWRWSRPPHDDFHLSDIRPILRGQYDLIILGGWDEPTYLFLWIWAVLSRKKIVFWIESTANDMTRSWVKETYKRMLIRQVAGCIVPGLRAYQYCQQLGMPTGRIFIAPNATDRAFFRSQAELLIPGREDLKAEAGICGLVVLFVGRLVEALKGVSILIRACSQLERRGFSVSLLLAGNGPDRRQYQELALRERLKGIRFLGTLDHEALCCYYAMADVLVQPSRSDPWGFVLNEGMEFGLPLVVSEVVGAGSDLVRAGENGFVFPVGDESALAKILEQLACDEALRIRMGEVSRSIIQNFSPERWVHGVIQAIDSITGEAQP